ESVMNNTSKTTRALVEGALMVAAAEALGFIKIWHMPEGGSVSLMMLPIVLYALRWGMGQGLLAGCALGIIDFMLGGGIAIGWQSILGDYDVACTLIGLAGVGHNKPGVGGVVLGSAVGCLGRYAAVWVTGATLWGEYMYDIYGLPMNNEWVYSALYNLPTLVSGVLTTIIAVLLIKPMQRLPKVE
ncbi:MAG: energy-coupled thiamine transporter ThiT, partial [Oscillospiraceae bacterium]|nr:energy-coupled thiamine transporter ThiT [Oscillospiraceae bacterium]